MNIKPTHEFILCGVYVSRQKLCKLGNFKNFTLAGLVECYSLQILFFSRAFILIYSYPAEEHLCAWNERVTMLRRKSEKPTMSSKEPSKSSSVVNIKKSHSSNSKYRSPKWYLGYSKQDSRMLPECNFQHFTDTNRYMEEYRKIKELRMRRNLDCHNELQLQSRDNSLLTEDRRQPVCFTSSHGETPGFGYRLEFCKDKINRTGEAQEKRYVIYCES